VKVTKIEAVPVYYQVTPVYDRMFGTGKAAGTAVHSREAWFANIRYKENVIVRVHTDEGLVGYGEALAHPVTGETLQGILEAISHLSKLVVGKDPFSIAEIVAAFDAYFLHGNMNAQMAIDMALYDLMGKAAGVPVYKLLGGGYRTTMGMCAHVARSDPKSMAEDALEWVKQGYRTLEPKMVGRQESVEEDMRRIEAVLEAVPKDVLIIADPNQTWGNAKKIIEMLTHRLQGVTNFALEQPVYYQDLNSLERITKSVPHTIIADEAAYSPAAVFEIARRQAADMVSIKLGKNAGFHKSLRCIQIAEAAGLDVRIDWVQASRLVDTATAHLHANVRNVGAEPAVDYHLRIADEIVKEGGIAIKDGVVTLPEAPGLGVIPDEEVIERLSRRTP
jgi:L-Ala-D/L-Glu epimerase